MTRALLAVWLALPLFVGPASAQEFIGRGSRGATHAVPSANALAQLQARDMIEQAQAAQRAALPPLCNVSELVAAAQAYARFDPFDMAMDASLRVVRGVTTAKKEYERARPMMVARDRFYDAVQACSP